MKTDGAQIIGKLERMRQLLLRRDAMIFNVTAEAEGLRRIEPELDRLAGMMPNDGTEDQDWPLPDYPRCQGLTIPAKVNYVAKGADLTKLGFEPNGAAIIASHWLRGGWLWEKVRVQGGAYTSFAAVDSKSGIFYFASYRDPNLLDTLAIYDGTADYLRNAASSDTDRERAIIGTIGRIDPYELPDAKGLQSMYRYLNGADDAWLQAMRTEILSATAGDIRGFADALDAIARDGRIVVMGAEDTLKAAGGKLPEPFTLTRLM